MEPHVKTLTQSGVFILPFCFVLCYMVKKRANLDISLLHRHFISTLSLPACKTLFVLCMHLWLFVAFLFCYLRLPSLTLSTSMPTYLPSLYSPSLLVYA